MPTPRYGDYQWDIYLPGLQGKLPKYPVDYPPLERAAASDGRAVVCGVRPENFTIADDGAEATVYDE